MYVDDIEDMDELRDIETELEAQLDDGDPSWGSREQLANDLEDIRRRMQEIDPTREV